MATYDFVRRPAGPAVEGTWSDEVLALRKSGGFVGSHGSQDGVTINPVGGDRGIRVPVRTWTEGRGVHGAA